MTRLSPSGLTTVKPALSSETLMNWRASSVSNDGGAAAGAGAAAAAAAASALRLGGRGELSLPRGSRTSARADAVFCLTTKTSHSRGRDGAPAIGYDPRASVRSLPCLGQVPARSYTARTTDSAALRIGGGGKWLRQFLRVTSVDTAGFIGQRRDRHG